MNLWVCLGSLGRIRRGGGWGWTLKIFSIYGMGYWKRICRGVWEEVVGEVEIEFEKVGFFKVKGEKNFKEEEW